MAVYSEITTKQTDSVWVESLNVKPDWCIEEPESINKLFSAISGTHSRIS